MAFLILHKHDEVESFALNLPVFSGLVFSIPLRVALFMIFVSLEKTGAAHGYSLSSKEVRTPFQSGYMMPRLWAFQREVGDSMWAFPVIQGSFH